VVDGAGGVAVLFLVGGVDLVIEAVVGFRELDISTAPASIRPA
jgi:hypothetical protein